MGYFYFTTALFTATSFVLVSLAQARCTSDYKLSHSLKVANKMTVDGINKNPDLQPAIVRASFHDCTLVSKQRPKSGCNGSIRLPDEYNDQNNDRVVIAVDHAMNISKATCLSVADSLLVSMSVVVQRAKGPNVLPYIISLKRQRDDATESDRVQGPLDLPQSNSDLASLIAYYKTRGFTIRDFVASTAGGHSLGAFVPDASRSPTSPGSAVDTTSNILPITPASTGPTCPPPELVDGSINFTPENTVISNEYSRNVLHFAKTSCNLPGYNLLRSDADLTDSKKTLRIIASYVINGDVLIRDFARFLIKMSNLTGSIL